MSGGPSISVVLCTYNRRFTLTAALQALVDQEAGAPAHEIIVVDNNSSDDTHEVVAPFSASHGVHYVFEAQQGLSAARNRGIALARAPLIAFTDDDVRVDRRWLSAMVRTAEEHPVADWFGGPVEPVWPSAPPAWLVEAGSAPLAIVDYGDEPMAVSPVRPISLLGANLAVRRRLFDRIGDFATHLQRCRDGVGSTEDHDLQIRAMRAGLTGWYSPDIIVRAEVAPERLSKGYYRRWHTGHGRYFAMMRDPSFERSRTGFAFGVPAHVYRTAVREGCAWLMSIGGGRPAQAFAHELRVRFLAAYARQRLLEGVRCLW